MNRADDGCYGRPLLQTLVAFHRTELLPENTELCFSPQPSSDFSEIPRMIDEDSGLGDQSYCLEMPLNDDAGRMTIGFVFQID